MGVVDNQFQIFTGSNTTDYRKILVDFGKKKFKSKFTTKQKVIIDGFLNRLSL